MFYRELYPVLGKLFYHIAKADGKVQPAEREVLIQFIKTNWEPLESSIDRHGSDQADLVYFDFDFLEAEGEQENGFDVFKDFYQENKARFSPAIISNILRTSASIASVYHEREDQEQNVLDRLTKLFED